MKIKFNINKINNIIKIKKEITATKNNTSVLLSPEDYKLYVHYENQTFEVSPAMSANLELLSDRNRNSNLSDASAILYEIREIKHDPDIQACISKIVNQLTTDNMDRSNEERSNENEKDSAPDNSEAEEEVKKEREKEGEEKEEQQQGDENSESNETDENDKEKKDRQGKEERGQKEEDRNDNKQTTADPVEELLKDLELEDDADIDNKLNRLDGKEETKEKEEKTLEEDLEEGECEEADINLDSFKVVKNLLKKDNKKLKEAIKNILENGENPKEKEGIKKALKNPKNGRIINKLIQEAENELKFELPDNPRNDHNTIYFLNSMPDWIKRHFKGSKYRKEARELEKAFRKLLNDLGLDAYSPRLDAKEVIKRIETARDPSKAYKRELETKKLLLAFDISGSMSAFIPVALPALKLSATYPNLTVILHTNFGINCIIENGKIKENRDYSKNLEIWKEYIKDTEIFISLSDWDGGQEWEMLFEQTKKPPKKTYWLMPFSKENNYSQSYINKLIKNFKNVHLEFDIKTISDYSRFVIKEILKK